jgi:pimeloyl-ACP methyl ester carboxylesterase
VRRSPLVRLGFLLLAVILAAPATASLWSAVLVTAFLGEFLSGGRFPVLSAITPRVVARPLEVPGAAVDVFVRSRPHGVDTPSTRPAGRYLVLVHGFAPEGKDDRRLRAAAALLAQTGFDVAVPTIPGLTRGRLRPDDAEPVVATIGQRPGPTTVVAVSVGAGPAMLAAADRRVRERVVTVLALGGYASAHSLVRFLLTGEYHDGDLRGRTAHDPDLVRAFIAANADLVSPQDLRDLESLDPRRIGPVLTRPTVGRLLDELSPERVVGEIPARLLLVHGRHDAAVPYTESLRLAAARRGRTSVALIGVIGHVEGDHVAGSVRALADLAALWRITYVMIAGADSGPA